MEQRPSVVSDGYSSGNRDCLCVVCEYPNNTAVMLRAAASSVASSPTTVPGGPGRNSTRCRARAIACNEHKESLWFTFLKTIAAWLGYKMIVTGVHVAGKCCLNSCPPTHPLPGPPPSPPRHTLHHLTPPPHRSWPRHHDIYCVANHNGSGFCSNPDCSRNPPPPLEDQLLAAMLAQVELMQENILLKEQVSVLLLVLPSSVNPNPEPCRYLCIKRNCAA